MGLNVDKTFGFGYQRHRWRQVLDSELSGFVVMVVE